MSRGRYLYKGLYKDKITGGIDMVCFAQRIPTASEI